MAITINDLKKLSPQAKALIAVVIVFIIAYLYYFLLLKDVLAKKTELETKYQSVSEQIKQKEKIVLQLDTYKAEVESLQENYKIALLKLPDQREIPELFRSVSLAGRDVGIEFALFEPKAAVPKTLDVPPKTSQLMKPSDQRAQSSTAQTPVANQPVAKKGGKNDPAQEPQTFYEEIPVKVTVTGSFQNIVHFFEKVAKLPRIVNISDIAMGDRKDVKGRGYVITTSCTVKTYMFVDKKEQSSENKNEKK